jgi:hypothetical protein
LNITKDCDYCSQPLPTKGLAKRIKQSKSGLLFCSKQHKNDALKAAMSGDERFLSLIPKHYNLLNDDHLTKRKYVRNNIHWSRDERICPGCSRTYIPKRREQIFCRQSCNHKLKNRIKLENWLNGDWDSAQTTDGSLLRWVRDYLLEQTQYRCSKCCWSEVGANGTIPLEIDHIDGNWKNSHPENLRVLCPNCHALTENWKVYNKGNEQSRYAYWKEQGWH